MLICDSRPQTPLDVGYHTETIGRLAHIASQEEAQHVILCGPHGTGKKLILQFYLDALYGEGCRDLRNIVYSTTSSDRKINIPTSPYHIEITPSKKDGDKKMLLEVIGKYASYGIFEFYKKGRTFKTVVIREADCLTSGSQATLRQTIEKHSSTCRFILLCRDLTPILAPLRSRCAIFSLRPPTTEEVERVILTTAIRWNLNYTSETREKVRSEGSDIHRALWRLEEERWNVPLELDITAIYDELVDHLLAVGKGTSPPFLLYRVIRKKIYTIRTTMIEHPNVIRNLTERLILRLPEEQANEVIHAACDAELAESRGRRTIIMHVDWFISRVMCIILRQ